MFAGGESEMIAKVFARIFDFTSSPAMDDGQMVFTVEWKRITGSRQAGKLKVTVSEISSDNEIKNELKQELADYLSDLYAPEVFKPKDIVGYSV